MNILFTILNWGLGHAVRCITLINHLNNNGHKISIASDGIALDFLKKEFPNLTFYELPPYDIKYKYHFMPLNIIEKTPQLIKSIIKEKKAMDKITQNNQIDLIINDNRLACYHKSIPSVYITHQLNVPAPNRILHKITNLGHQYFVNKYDYCWIPDFANENNLAGSISKSKKIKPPIQYLGPLSNIRLENTESRLSLLVVLSGPEPQRSYLENKIINQATELDIEFLIVRGTNTKRTFNNQNPNLRILDLVNRKELTALMEQAQRIICRSGYTSLMDFYLNPKPLYFIPTPGQWEQEYLAEHWQKNMGVPYSTQKEFNLKEAYEQASMPKINCEEPAFKKAVDAFIERIRK